MFISVEEFKKRLSDGTEKLKDDEYIGDDGLLYCKQCKTPRFCLIDLEIDRKVIVRTSNCKCEQEKDRREEERQKRDKIVAEFRERQELSLLGKRYQNAMFENAVITPANKAVYTTCVNYVKNAQEIFEKNIGLYVYGDNSSGKTYLTACMCNELVYKGFRCVYTNYASILNEIKSSYDGNGIGEREMLCRLQNYEFVFIDDFGKEFLGREHNSASCKWAEEKLFEIINARYNAAQPTIFSSNYSISELASVLRLDKAIVERINEISTRVLKLNGEDWRERSRQEKSEAAKKLGI